MSGIVIAVLVILIFCKIKEVNQKMLHEVNRFFKKLETYFRLKVEVDLQCVVEFGNNSEITSRWLYKLELIDGVHLRTEKHFFYNLLQIISMNVFDT